MSAKDEFVRKMHAQLDRWNAEIDVLAAKARVAEAEARADFEEQIEDLRRERDKARQKLEALDAASEGAWQDLKNGVEQAWDSVTQAVRSATSRFK